jgi:hypothetical protein
MRMGQDGQVERSREMGKWNVAEKWAGGTQQRNGQVERRREMGRWNVAEKWAGGT